MGIKIEMREKKANENDSVSGGILGAFIGIAGLVQVMGTSSGEANAARTVAAAE